MLGQSWLIHLADGNIGVIQTMVGELVKKPEHEREISLHSRILG